MVYFIMFPGFGDPSITWEFDGKNPIEFLDQIKKIGEVFVYTPIYHNLNYYKKDNNEAKYYDKNINFDLDYLNVEKHCKMIYEQVKKITSDKFILVSHSAGNLYAYYFSKLYKDECLFSLVLDGRLMGKQGFEQAKDYIEKYNTKYKNITNDDLFELQQKIINNKDNNNLIDEMNDIISSILLSQLPQMDKFPIKTIYFRNLEIHETYVSQEKKQEKEQRNLMFIKEAEGFKNSDPDFEVVWFINKTHWPFAFKECSDAIIEKINSLLPKYKHHGGNNGQIYYEKYTKYKSKYLKSKFND